MEKTLRILDERIPPTTRNTKIKCLKTGEQATIEEWATNIGEQRKRAHQSILSYLLKVAGRANLHADGHFTAYGLSWTVSCE